MPASPLLARTRELLSQMQDEGLTLTRIAREAQLHPRWLEKFSRGEIPAPGVSRLEKLYTYLNGEALKV